MQCGARHAGPVEKLDGGGGAQGGLLGGFSEDAVSSGKRRGYLAEKDRQRKVPRADADEHASPMTIESIVFPGGPGQDSRVLKQPARFMCVIAAEIDCLPPFADRVLQCLARLGLQQAQQCWRL